MDLMLDEEDTKSDTPLPSSRTPRVTPHYHQASWLKALSRKILVEWTKKNMGDTHVSKRKMQFMLPKTRKKGKETVTGDDTTDSGDKSPPYQESVDSSSAVSSDDEGGDGSGSGIGGSGGRSEIAHLIYFTCTTKFGSQ